MKPITDFTVTEVSLSWDNFSKLNPKTRRLIEVYASNIRHTGNGFIVFEIASYQWTEIQEAQEEK